MSESPLINVRLEESRGVRRCLKCKVSIHPGVLNLSCIRIIECKFTPKGKAYKKEHYCLTCAEPILNVAIAEQRKVAIGMKEQYLYFKNTTPSGHSEVWQNRINRAWKKVKEYKNFLRVTKNWNLYFEQIFEQKTLREFLKNALPCQVPILKDRRR